MGTREKLFISESGNVNPRSELILAGIMRSSCRSGFATRSCGADEVGRNGGAPPDRLGTIVAGVVRAAAARENAPTPIDQPADRSARHDESG